MNNVIKEATLRQQEAARASASVWVSANAGSGKTRVLTQRVARLLLERADPSRILCLTYTKAAAAEMANRLFDTLGRWSMLQDAELHKELQALTGGEPDVSQLPEARRLFAMALETPGGIKIETIHAFCQRVLQRFPVEARVPPDFTVLDEREAHGLTEEAMRLVLRSFEGGGDELEAAFERVFAAKGEKVFKDIIEGGIAGRRKIERFVTSQGAALTQSVRAALNLMPDETLVRIRAGRDIGRDTEALLHAANCLKLGSSRDQDRAADLEAYLKSESDPHAFGAYYRVFFDSKEKPREDIATKTVKQDHPEIASAFEREQERLSRQIEHEKAAEIADVTIAALTLMRAIFDEYRRLKQARRALDYEDLIAHTSRLLEETSALWVHYKLDGGIDHLLVDEAQDTSPEQWAIIAALTSEFFTQEASTDQRMRTVFAVGDEKQSIYSFQGADPDKFAEMAAHFEQMVRASGREWSNAALEVSFRSAREILDAVDKTFVGTDAEKALTAAGEPIRHFAARERDKGLVELWDFEKREAIDLSPHKNWTLEVDATRPGSPESKVAIRIADLIRHWIDTGTPLTQGGAAIDCGDILILVRRRGAIFYETIRALNSRGLAIAGADRMVLRDEIAFLDLDALARFCVFPQDDLALAEVLKGPFCELSEKELMNLASRRERSLWRALSGDERYRSQHTWLTKRMEEARTLRPFEFFSRALDGPERMRRAMIERLGVDAQDVIEEFLSLALAYEREEAPTLQGFLRYVKARGDEVRRDMEEAGGRIRVMTIHGAKGLEAPIVFLIDTCTEPLASREPWLLSDEEGSPPLVRFAAALRDTVSKRVAETESEQQAHEYLRQLYVGMTRAKDRLYIAGVAGQRDFVKKGGPLKPGCWHARIEAALSSLGAETVVTAAGPVLRYGEEPQGVGTNKDAGDLVRVPLPAWLDTALLSEPGTVRRTPSGFTALEESKMPSFVPGSSTEAIVRGRFVHKLLEELPKLSAGERASAARRISSLARFQEIQASADDLVAETQNILANPEFAPIFDPESRAEVALVGSFLMPSGRRMVVSGQVDRLLVTPNRVLVVDFKTNRQVPDPIPGAYLSQMAAYRRLLMEIFAGWEIEAALLFTSIPRLMPLSAADLDAIPITDGAPRLP